MTDQVGPGVPEPQQGDQRPEGQRQPGRRARVRHWLAMRVLTGPGWNGASAAIAVTAVGLWLWRSSEQVLPGAAVASWRIMASDLVAAVALALGVAVAGLVLALVVRRRLPVPWLATLAGAGLVVGTLAPGASVPGWLLITTLVLLCSGLVGGMLGGLVAGRSGRAPRPGRTRALSGLIGAGLALVLACWAAWPGPVGPQPHAPPTREGQATVDPSAAGEFDVQTLTYGSAEPGAGSRFAQVDLVTDSVDATGVIEGWEAGDDRSNAWGFDASALPLNAVVLAPVDDGPHPLVLIVHGNSPPRDSVMGFDYLAELLASRGYVVASIDQTFLNTGVLDGSGGIEGADHARAWLLLQHLAQWERWNTEEAGPVATAIDLDRVAVIGHSRGGEAAAVAAALTGSTGGPDLPGRGIVRDATIETVVALAPSEGLVSDPDDPPELHGVNYLTLGGSHDADVGAFAGTNQFARTTVDAAHVKAAVAVHRANHSQFNSRWGRHDVGLGLSRQQLATGALLDSEDQRQIAAVFTSAFLDFTLGGDRSAGELFDGTLPQAPWLPDTDYRVAAAAGDQSLVTAFTPAQVAEGMVQTEVGTLQVDGASLAIEPVPLRQGHSGNPALLLGAEQAADSVRVQLPADLLSGTEPNRLVVDLALATAVIPEAPVTVAVELTGDGGHPGVPTDQ